MHQWIVASKLQHPNVVQLRDVQVSESHIFLIMELASGNELFDRGACVVDITTASQASSPRTTPWPRLI